MDRRRVITTLAAFSGLIAFPQVRAQGQSKVRRIGFLAARSRSTPSRPDVIPDGFLEGMRDLGYVEGKNLLVEWRFADANYARLPALAAELVALKVEVIATYSTPATRALQLATSTIPIVTAAVIDPVGSGYAKSLARPGGNITGLSNATIDLSTKYIELLRTLKPDLSRVAFLMNPGTAAHSSILERVQTTAKPFGIKILPARAGNAQEIPLVFEQLAKEQAEAVIVAVDAFFIQQHKQIADAAASKRMLSLFPYRVDADVGGLMSYASNLREQSRRAAVYVDKILKGAKPGELPFEQPTKFEFIINLRTAKALGLTMPQDLLVRADEVIE